MHSVSVLYLVMLQPHLIQNICLLQEAKTLIVVKFRSTHIVLIPHPHLTQNVYLSQDAKTLIILKFRSTHKLPSRGHVYDVMSPYGKIHMEDDIWFNEPRSVAFVRFKWELDAGNAQKALDRMGNAMFNLPEVQQSLAKLSHNFPCVYRLTI